MTVAKLFRNGRSQAVRLPKEYCFAGDEVLINKVGDIVLLTPKDSQWAGFLQGLEMFTPDFMEEGRAPQEIQEHENL